MENLKTTEQPESKLHFLDYWRIIRIRKTVILAVFLLVVLTTVAVTFIMPESFSSTVRIEVQKDTPDIPGMFQTQSREQFDPYFMESQFQILQSKSVLYKVIEDAELDLNRRWAKRFGERTLKTGESFMVLLRKMDVRQTRNTSLIEVRVRDENPEDAALIANKIAEVYKNYRIDQKREMVRNGVKALNGKLEEQEKKVKELQAQADRLREENQITDIAEGSTYYGTTLEPETLRQLESGRVVAQAQYIEISKLLEELGKKDSKELRKSLLTARPDAQLDELLRALNLTEQQKAKLAPVLGTENLDLVQIVELEKKINEQINARIDGIMEGLRMIVASLEAKLQGITQEVEAAKKRDIENTKKFRPYYLVKRDLETAIAYRNALQAKILQETVDLELPRQSIVTITDPAEPGQRPVVPNIPLNIALGVIVGLVMGIGLAFFIEYLDTSVKTIDDVERSLQAPVLGVIPQNVGSLLVEGPESPHAEAYRVLRTNLIFQRKNSEANSLTVVSGGAGEGKSTTVFNLACVFAQQGQRVLLVDSDLRRPSLHKLFGVTNALGLTNYLLKQNTLEEVVQTTKQQNLDFLPSGKLPSSSLGILNSAQMKEFVKEVKRRYDFVFFDSPPIMGVSDASILASVIDLSLLVIQYRKYPQQMTIRAKQMVEKVGGVCLGVVLNNINISQDSYYYYYSGYYYDYYSKYEYDYGDKYGDKYGDRYGGDRYEGRKRRSRKNGEPEKAKEEKPAEGDKPATERGGVDIKQKY
jgi:capsular exopolysaccharide synthesis family protein